MTRHSHASAVWILAVVTFVLCLTLGILHVFRPTKTTSSTDTSRSVRVIDTTSTITDEKWFKQAYDEGFRLYVLHSTNWDTCEEWYRTKPQLKMAVEAGLKIAAYTRDPRCWQGGIAATGVYADELQFFALDIETLPGIPVTRNMVDGVKAMGVRPVIYTGSGMWKDVQAGNNEDFSDVPLWDTNVSDFDYATWTADYMQPTPVKYGGWNTSATMRVGIQQQFEYTLNGIKIDLNSFDTQFLK